MPPSIVSVMTVTALSLGLTLGTSTAAEACSCVLPNLNVAAPADGAVDVPINARLWMGGASPEPRLYDAAGLPVPGTVTVFGSLAPRGDPMGVFTPNAPLIPGATYTGRGAHGSTTFTVGTEQDTTPPPVPSITSRLQDPGRTFGGAFGGSDCDSADHRLLTLGIADRAVVTLVDINGTSTLDTNLPEGSISVMSGDDDVYIGKAACVNSWEGTGDIVVRVGTFDVAGNFSGWSEASPEAVETGGCSCDGTGSALPQESAWLLGALGLGLLIRRRR